MSRGLGRIERLILAEIEVAKQRRDLVTGAPGTVLLSSWALSCDRTLPGHQDQPGWTPSRTRRQAVVRAMHSFVRKFPQYALAGGEGRRKLYLYEAADPLSTLWARLCVERGFAEAQRILNELAKQPTERAARLPAVRQKPDFLVRLRHHWETARAPRWLKQPS